MNNNERLIYLLSQAKSGLASPEEIGELLDLLKSDSSGEVTNQVSEFHNEVLANGVDKEYDFDFWNTVADRVLESDRRDDETIEKESAPVRGGYYWWWAAAAIVLILLGTGSYFLLQRNYKPKEQLAITGTTEDVLPGKDGAILTLADGRKIVLDSLGNGLIATQGNTEVKLQNGQLLYGKNNKKPGDINDDIIYNTITTSKGRQYRLVLPDGSKIWLNAASSLKYPIAFKGRERMVEVTGEAYFEVVHNKQMPFRVKTGDQLIEDIGTAFNVYAYEDEHTIRTSLLEGAIQLSNTRNTVTVKPGEQAFAAMGGNLEVRAGDVQQAVAWKNGFFAFDNVEMKTMMRQLARWYDIEVVYETSGLDDEFAGEIPRSSTLKEVLKILKITGLKFRLDNKKLIVTGKK